MVLGPAGGRVGGGSRGWGDSARFMFTLNLLLLIFNLIPVTTARRGCRPVRAVRTGAQAARLRATRSAAPHGFGLIGSDLTVCLVALLRDVLLPPVYATLLALAWLYGARKRKGVPRVDAGFSRRMIPATSYSPRSLPRSTIGAERLNGRVRNGNGCGPLAMVTRKDRSFR